MPPHGHFTTGRSSGHGFAVDTPSPQDRARMMDQFRDEYSQLPDDQRQQWENKAGMGDVRSDRESGGSATTSSGSGSSLSSGGLQTGGLTTGGLSSGGGSASTPFAVNMTPRSASSAGGGYGNDAAPLVRPAEPAGMDPATARTLHGTATVADRQTVSRDAQNAANRAMTLPRDPTGFYGKLSQHADAPQDQVSTDEAGNQHVATVGGGTVDVPAAQPQDAPDGSFAASNGASTGIYANGKEQVKQPDGQFAVAATKLPITTGAPKPSTPLAPGASSEPDSMTASLLNGTATSDPSTLSSVPAPSSSGDNNFAVPSQSTTQTSLPDDEDDDEPGTTRAFPGTMPKARSRGKLPSMA